MIRRLFVLFFFLIWPIVQRVRQSKNAPVVDLRNMSLLYTLIVFAHFHRALLKKDEVIQLVLQELQLNFFL